jgi:membrane protein DedA with SNARE-associated domain
MHFSATYLLKLLIAHKYTLLFPVLVLEGPVATVLASYLSSPAGGQVLSIVIVSILVFGADVFGDTMYYTIGRFGKDYFTSRYPKRFSLDPKKTDAAELYFKKYGVRTMLVGKIGHGIGWPIMVGAGTARMPYGKFFTVSASVALVKSVVLISLGYYYGAHYRTLIKHLGETGLILTTLAVICIVYLILKNKRETRALANKN